MRPAISALVIALFALAWFAQQVSRPVVAVEAPPRGAVLSPPKGPMLTEEDGSPVKGVHLARADVRAVVRGSLAEATMTLTFANTENRVLGGELVFPLPEGASVTGYGLEINGVMVDGVAVEKQQARVIYEKELHKRVDPGLVEQAAGNSFRTRLYPVPANGTRSIKVQYVTDASATKDGLAVSLPLGWGANVDRCSVRIDAPDAAAEPSIEAAVLAFKKAEHGYVAEGELKDAPNELQIALPGLAERSVAIEKRYRPTVTVEDLDEQAKGGEASRNFERFEHYFVINDTPAAEAAPFDKLRIAPAGQTVKRLAVLWDAGLSRADGDKARELELLDALLKQWPEAQADLVVFRDKVEHPVSFNLNNADGRGEIIERLSHVVYDGASDLGDLPLSGNAAGFGPPAANGKTADYDCILLFTGGIAGMGPETMRKAEAPVYAFSNEARADHAMLRQVCRESGGQYFNLERLTDKQVLPAVAHEAYSLVSIDAKPEEVAEVYPGAGAPANGRVALAGKLLVPEATITLNYGFGKRITHSQSFTLKAADATEGNLIPRYWAQQKVAELSMQPGANQEELAKVGKQFNLVTPNTSLLVLETAEQYVQYRVVPPKNRPDVYKQFLAQIEQNKVQERQTKEEKIQEVLAMWNGRVKWWEQEYKYPAGFRLGRPAEDKVVPLAGAVPAAAPPQGDYVIRKNDLQTIAIDDLTGPGTQTVKSVRVNESGDITLPHLGSPIHVEGLTETQLEQAVADRYRTENIIQRPRVSVIVTESRGRAFSTEGQAGQAALAEPSPVPAPQRPPQQQAGTLGPVEIRSPIAPRTDAPQLHRDALAESDPHPGGAAPAAPNMPVAQREFPLLSSRLGNDEVRLRRLERDVSSIEAAEGSKDIPEKDGAVSTGTAVTITPWDPATPYLAAMKAVPADKAYGVFLEERKAFGKSPAFYLDCGDYLDRLGQHELAVRVLTDVAALRLADARLLRVAAHRLQQIGERGIAIDLFEKVLKMRPEEPQSHRDLALALSDRADALADLPRDVANRDSMTGRIAADYARSLDLLNQVLVGRWDRFQEIELPCLMEANRIIARVNRLKQAGEIADVPIPLDPRFVKDLECDLRVVMTWDADNTDIDLWVTEPSGEKCYYEHNRTTIGGMLSKDFTDGYGPEEYCLRKLMPGKFAIQANFYGSRQQELTGPCTVAATVFTNFGRPTEKKQSLTLRLVEAKDVVDIGSVELGGKEPAGRAR